MSPGIILKAVQRVLNTSIKPSKRRRVRLHKLTKAGAARPHRVPLPAGIPPGFRRNNSRLLEYVRHTALTDCDVFFLFKQFSEMGEIRLLVFLTPLKAHYLFPYALGGTVSRMPPAVPVKDSRIAVFSHSLFQMLYPPLAYAKPFRYLRYRVNPVKSSSYLTSAAPVLLNSSYISCLLS
jgi:hypothetical protein